MQDALTASDTRESRLSAHLSLLRKGFGGAPFIAQCDGSLLAVAERLFDASSLPWVWTRRLVPNGPRWDYLLQGLSRHAPWVALYNPGPTRRIALCRLPVALYDHYARDLDFYPGSSVTDVPVQWQRVLARLAFQTGLSAHDEPTWQAGETLVIPHHRHWAYDIVSDSRAPAEPLCQLIAPGWRFNGHQLWRRLRELGFESFLPWYARAQRS